MRGCIGDDGVWLCKSCPHGFDYDKGDGCERYLWKNSRRSLPTFLYDEAIMIESTLAALDEIQTSAVDTVQERELINKFDQAKAKLRDAYHLLHDIMEEFRM